jgi:hypothetical protein
MPWSVAGDAGKIDIVVYQTSFYDGATIPDNYPASASWNVYFAQNLAATPGGSFNQAAASPVNHFGGVCESGATCTSNRDLFDGRETSPTMPFDDVYTVTPSSLRSMVRSSNRMLCAAVETQEPSVSERSEAGQPVVEADGRRAWRPTGKR